MRGTVRPADVASITTVCALGLRAGCNDVDWDLQQEALGPSSPLTRAGTQPRWDVLAYLRTTLRVAATATKVWRCSRWFRLWRGGTAALARKTKFGRCAG